MSEPSDAALLKEWSAGGSEEAFAILARRYAGLLYHAAMRRTGSEDLAGEATQNTLLVLARKASRLGNHPSLAGWLHRTACLEASMLMRRERRHEARMKRFHLHHGEDDSDASWQAAAPLLDKALDALPESDRQVIFLKYFDGLSFEQMARQFGGEPAAWRQRGSRATERLRLALTKRGVPVSSTALATGLGTTLSQAAPTSLLATLSASPAAGAAALSWQTLTAHSLHFMKLHPATWVLATLILSAIPLSIQAMSNSAARQRVTGLESAASGASASQGAQGKNHSSLSASSKATLLTLADQVYAGSNGSMLSGLEARSRIKDLSEEELEELLLQTTSLELSREKRQQVLNSLFIQYAYKKSPKVPVEKVLRLAGILSDRLGTEGQEAVWGWAGVRFKDWAKEDPDKARVWFQEEVKSGRLDSARLNLSMPGMLYTAFRLRSEEEAQAFYNTLDENQRTAVIYHFQASGTPEEFLDMAANLKEPANRKKSLETMFQYATKERSPEEVRGWLERAGTTGDEAADLLAIAAEGAPYQEDGGVLYHRGMKEEKIEARLEWLRDPAIGDDAPAAIGAFLAGTFDSSPEATGRILEREWESHQDEEMLASYISHAGSSARGVLDALIRSKRLTDPVLRERALRTLMAGDGADEARKGIQKGALSAEEIKELDLPAGLLR